MKSKQPEPLEQPKQVKRDKPKTRGNGQGSVAQLPSGSWHWEIRLSGQRYGGTKSTKTAAMGELARVRTDFERGVLASADKTTFEKFANKWRERQKHLSPNTRRMYTHDLGYTFKIIGAMKLKDIRPTHLKAMLEQLSNQVMNANRNAGKTMSTRTLGMVRARIRSIFTEAVQDQIIYVNPADAVRRVKSAKHTEDFEGTALDFASSRGFTNSERLCINQGLVFFGVPCSLRLLLVYAVVRSWVYAGKILTSRMVF